MPRPCRTSSPATSSSSSDGAQARRMCCCVERGTEMVVLCSLLRMVEV